LFFKHDLGHGPDLSSLHLHVLLAVDDLLALELDVLVEQELLKHGDPSLFRRQSYDHHDKKPNLILVVLTAMPRCQFHETILDENLRIKPNLATFKFVQKLRFKIYLKHFRHRVTLG
jgi:hypothetical protein